MEDRTLQEIAREFLTSCCKAKIIKSRFEKKNDMKEIM